MYIYKDLYIYNIYIYTHTQDDADRHGRQALAGGAGRAGDPNPQTLHTPYTTLNPKPHTPNTKPQAPHPKPNRSHKPPSQGHNEL